MQIKTFTLNEIGGRKNVEDAISPKSYSSGHPNLFIVCDGVGGSNFGEVASDIATKTFYEVIAGKLKEVSTQFNSLLTESLSLFKNRIKEYIATNPAAQGTSTTLTLAVIHDGDLYAAWCGDSRIYVIRDGKILYKTQDHSLVAELVGQGVISEQEALNHPQRNIITRSISSDTKPTDISTKVIKGIQSGDWILLCTDGLLEQFTEDKFSSLFSSYDASLNYANHINKICEGKTKDNYSMYLLHIQSTPKKSKSITWLWALLFIAAIGGGGYYYYTNFLQKEPPAEPQPANVQPVISIMKDDETGDSGNTKNKDSNTQKKDSPLINKSTVSSNSKDTAKKK